jgi:hypothetical protein
MQVSLRICVRNAPASALVFWDEKRGNVSAFLGKIFLNFVYIDGRISALDKNFVVIIKVYNLRFESVDAPRKTDGADDQKRNQRPPEVEQPHGVFEEAFVLAPFTDEYFA